MWPIIRSLWFLLIVAASLVVLALNIHLQVSRVSLASLGFKPGNFNITHGNFYILESASISVAGPYIHPLIPMIGIIVSATSIWILLPASVTSFGTVKISVIFYLVEWYCEISRVQLPYTSMISLELLSSLLLSVDWFVYGYCAIKSMACARTDSDNNNGLCLEIQVLKGMALTLGFTMVAYFLTLLVLALIGRYRGQRLAFIWSTRAPGFFYSAPSPSPVHLDISTSQYCDARSDQNEMMPVPTRPPMHGRQVILEDGKEDVQLDQYDDSKLRNEDTEVTSLLDT